MKRMYRRFLSIVDKTFRTLTHNGRVEVKYMSKTKGLLIALASSAFIACSSSYEPVTVDTNSNWLKACDSSEQCGGELSCICLVCTISCRRQTDYVHVE